MRITDRMMVDQVLYNLREGRSRLGQAHNQVATGRRLLKPSDEPADVERAMTLSSEIRGLDRTMSNLKITGNWLRDSEQSLQDLGDVMGKARSLALTALDDTYSAEERASMASQMDGMMENALSIANTRHGEYYLFGGSQISAEPFTLNTATGTVDYNGDDLAVQHPIEPGHTMKVNISGREGANGAIAPDRGMHGVLNRLEELRQALYSDDPTAVRQFVTDIDQVSLDIQASQGVAGARMQRVESTETRLEQREVDLKSLYSQLVDADMAETIASMSAEDRAYEMTLATAARVMPRSLLDFLG